MAAYPPPSPRDQMRAQRHYWRSLRRSSIVSPLLLIAFGVLALLVELGKLSALAVWSWYVRWWPALLIAIGVISLGEWWLDRENPYGRRRGYGGIVALLILLAIIGYANPRVRGGGVFGRKDGDDWIFQFWGRQHDSVHNLNQEIPSAAWVEIQAPHGDVTVTASADSQMHVQSHEVVYASNDDDAQSALAALQPQLTVSGKTVTLRSASRENGRVDLIVEIPADATPTINAGRGDVTVQDLSTPLTLNAGRGNVKLNNLKAAAEARLGRGDFSAHAITGDLSLRGRLNDVSISDVDGRAILDGDFFGDTHIAHVTSQVSVHSNRTVIELAHLPGAFSRESGDIQVNNAAGPILIATRAKDVACTGITGDARIEDADGEISLGLAGQPGEIQVHSRNGAIRLTVPQDASFALQASARHGEIHSDFGLPIESMGSGHSVSSNVGSGGARIELIADHGDIRISRSDVAAAPANPASPAINAPAPHLRVPQGTVPVLKTQ